MQVLLPLIGVCPGPPTSMPRQKIINFVNKKYLGKDGTFECMIKSLAVAPSVLFTVTEKFLFHSGDPWLILFHIHGSKPENEWTEWIFARRNHFL